SRQAIIRGDLDGVPQATVTFRRALSAATQGTRAVAKTTMPTEVARLDIAKPRAEPGRLLAMIPCAAARTTAVTTRVSLMARRRPYPGWPKLPKVTPRCQAKAMPVINNTGSNATLARVPKRRAALGTTIA